MNAVRSIAIAGLLTVLLAAGNSEAQMSRGANSAVTVGVRQYNTHPTDPDFPFADGDLGYNLSYEYHEGNAYWQLGLGYAPHSSATSQVAGIEYEIEYVVTPQLHLIYQDGLFLMGVGALKHYVNDTEGKHWTSLYWELLLGLQLPISNALSIQGLACYQFKSWSDLGDLDTSEIEFGVNLSCKF